MKKQLMIVGLMLVLLTIGLSGCTEEESGNGTETPDDSSKFIGTWNFTSSRGEEASGNQKNLTLIFNEDGTIIRRNPDTVPYEVTGTWELKGGKLSISGVSPYGDYDYSFTNNDQTLTLNPWDMVYTKQ